MAGRDRVSTYENPAHQALIGIQGSHRAPPEHFESNRYVIVSVIVCVVGEAESHRCEQTR